jgi:hypothetical protein
VYVCVYVHVYVYVCACVCVPGQGLYDTSACKRAALEKDFDRAVACGLGK